jgi:hypothetical protein
MFHCHSCRFLIVTVRRYVLSTYQWFFCYHQFDFVKVEQDGLLDFEFCLLPWIFTNEWWQTM